MITVDDTIKILKKLTANYGAEFYKGTDEKDVIAEWASDFSKEEPAEVFEATQNCIDTMSFRPHIADIRHRMALNRLQGQMTATEAFHKITKAVRKSTDRESAVNAYNELEPILQKVVGDQHILRSWHNVSEEAYHTVIMSAIRESYRELAQREVDYYSMQKPLQRFESWRVPEQQTVALPEPEKQLSIDEMFDVMDQAAVEYREKYNMTVREDLSERVNAFKSPMTPEDLKRMEYAQRAKDVLIKKLSM